MENVGFIIFLISVITFWVFLFKGVKATIKKTGQAKTNFKKVGYSIGASLIAVIIIGATADDTETASNDVKDAQSEEVKKEENPKETPEQKAEREAKEEAEKKAKAEAKAKVEAEERAKKEAEKKAKAEAEAKAKAEAEAKAKAEAAAKKANAQSPEYARLKKNPDRYKGEYVKYSGQILQIQEEGDSSYIRLAVTQDEWGYNTEDVVWVEYNGLTDFIEEDIVTVYGEITGSFSYTSQAGWEITLPAVIADTVE